MEICSPLNDDYLPLYNTPEGSKCDELENCINHKQNVRFFPHTSSSKSSIWFFYHFFQSEAVYDATLQSVRESFPQYVRELEGIAHGAGVDFHKVYNCD